MSSSAELRGALLGVAAVLAVAAPASAELPLARQNELANLVRHDCGSCHGLTLRGGLGPALTPDALAERPLSTVRRVIRDGLPGSAMPPWRELLSDDDIDWIAGALLRGLDGSGS